ncbi:DUF1217 domain-containing protein [Acetobacter oeni]|uniref:Flagellar basal body rod protein FlgF n=1 Tax=Acetobacter oeni TaxID=304077 RepID=A0A511XHC7_9PROT|nr:DUF1217 domain-containing protein [Acetobacter oeni]MBB3881201.1 hypothetical protein [Acetobacter oeni]NHO18077.1 DUF1217 domain-containing protein [Acetobacter oeni]GBR08386.1 hypothetical protein AA21952_2602 [Acetobacter oeni LMG 21952]GEN62353.1 flagellar basal body rod protein FlgF [Acetobacter oeni]
MSGTISGLSPVSTYLADESNETKAAETYAKTDSTVSNYVKSFEETAPGITSADALLKNYKALTVVLGAYGLSSLASETALVKDLLTQDPTSSTSVAKKSDNATWLKFAEAFSAWNEVSTSSSSSSTSPFADPTALESTVSNYEQQAYETSLESSDSTTGTVSGVGNALYFTRSMTTSMTLDDIMSDSKLLTVVETVSGFNPTQFGALNYDEQKQLLSKAVNLTDFSSTKKIQQYAERYLATLQYAPQTVTKTNTLLSLYGADGSTNSTLSLFGITSSSTSLISQLFG